MSQLPARLGYTLCPPNGASKFQTTPMSTAPYRAAMGGFPIVQFPYSMPPTRRTTFSGALVPSPIAVVFILAHARWTFGHFSLDGEPRPAPVQTTLSAVAPLAFREPPVNSFRSQNPLFSSHFPAVPVPAAPVLPVLVGTTSARRTASALHSLPQHQGVVVNASAPHRGSRHPYPEQVSQGSASASNTTSGPSPFSTATSVSVLIWPFVVPGANAPAGFGTPILKIRNELLLNYVQAFDGHGLYLHPTVPSTDLASAHDFSRQLYTHLVDANLQLTLAPNVTDILTVVPFNQQPFVVLEASRYREVTTFRPCATMNDNSFSLETFKKLNKKAPNPNPDPRYRLEPLVITCLRILAPLQVSYENTHLLPDIECMDGYCPGGDSVTEVNVLCLIIGVAFPHSPQAVVPMNPPVVVAPPSASINNRPATPPNPPSMSLIRQRSPTSQGDPAGDRRVRPRADQPPVPFTLSAHANAVASQVLFMPNAYVNPAVSSQVPSTLNANANAVLPHFDEDPVPPPRPQLGPLVPGVDVASLRDVARWQNIVKLSVSDRAANPVSIAGESVDVVAECLLRLMLLIWERKDHMPETFVLPAGVSLCARNITIDSFFQSFATIRIGDTPANASTGPGPLRAMFRTAAKRLSTQHRFWKPLTSSAFIVPNLGLIRDDPPAARLTTFRAHGLFLALHCAVLGHGPLPISIWLLLALVLGKKAMLIPKNLLLHLDPVAYDVLAPWYDFHQDTPVPPASMPTHPLRLFMINVLNRQPSEIDNERTKEEHEAWHIMAFATVLLGDPAPFSHADFRSILRGFNLVLSERRLVEAVEDVSSHVVTFVTRFSADATTPYFVKLFEVLLKQYLNGVGHPEALRDIEVSDEEFMEHRTDHLLRANLMLGAAGDTDMCPMDKDWKILFRFNGRVDSTTAVAAPLHFHTCSYEVDVKIDRGMEQLLLSGVDSPSQLGTAFQTYLHSQLLSRKYNTALMACAHTMCPPPNGVCLKIPITSEHMAEGLAVYIKKSILPQVLVDLPMSSDPPRRSGRHRRPPPHADSPVSFAPFARLTRPIAEEELDSSSDESMLNEPPSTIGYNNDPDSDIEVIEAPETSGTPSSAPLIRNGSPDGVENSEHRSRALVDLQLNDFIALPDSAETLFMEHIDTVDGDCEKAVLLIAEIHRIRGTVAPVNSAPIQAPVAPILEMPVVTAPAMYFVGIRIARRCQTFAQVLDLAAPDPTLLERIISAGFPLGRALAAIQDRAGLLVGTSNMPVDAEEEFGNWQHNNFRELGAWSSLIPRLTDLTPTPESPLRSGLLSLRAVSSTLPLYVLYIYDELPAPIPAVQIATLFVSPPIAPIPAPAGPSAMLPSDAKSHYATIALAKSTFGTAYQHCIIERYAMKVANEVGIQFIGRTIRDAQVGNGLVIQLNDIPLAAGIPAATFQSFRTEFNKVRDVRARIRRFEDRRLDLQIDLNLATNVQRFETLRRLLDVMLAHEIVDDIFRADTTGDVRAQAANMSIGQLMGDVSTCRNLLKTYFT
ncbi:hypothetical protein B0H16DRAFT_1478655 [Mycena metata]|uniref:Uncharacterized protein n=1 Tax=Mycena metata TaxID=1033252 RepID=A0AAD7MEZ9_9AGAR|nr:hypothetical protein B0H16DRAFT_1478655 [Mycena metata]